MLGCSAVYLVSHASWVGWKANSQCTANFKVIASCWAGLAKVVAICPNWVNIAAPAAEAAAALRKSRRLNFLFSIIPLLNSFIMRIYVELLFCRDHLFRLENIDLIRKNKRDDRFKRPNWESSICGSLGTGWLGFVIVWYAYHNSRKLYSITSFHINFFIITD